MQPLSTDKPQPHIPLRSCPIMRMVGLLESDLSSAHAQEKEWTPETSRKWSHTSTTGRWARLIFTNINSSMTLQWIIYISSRWCRLMLEPQQIKTFGYFYIVCPCFEHVGMMITDSASIIQYSTSHRKQIKYVTWHIFQISYVFGCLNPLLLRINSWT